MEKQDCKAYGSVLIEDGMPVQDHLRIIQARMGVRESLCSVHLFQFNFAFEMLFFLGKVPIQPILVAQWISILPQWNSLPKKREAILKPETAKNLENYRMFETVKSKVLR